MSIQNSANEVSKKRRGLGPARWVMALVTGVAIFGFGIAVGSHDVTFGSRFESVAEGLPADLDYSEIEDLYDTLRKNFDGQLDSKELLEGLKQGLAGASGDNYTEYLNAEDAKAFDEELNGTFSGIGAELSKDKQAIVVVAPIDGFPAQESGLRAQDIIVEIDGESAHDLTLTEAVNQIRGPAGTDVTLTIIRDASQELDIKITRAQITIPSVESEILDGNIGYLKIARFADDTYPLARSAAEDFDRAEVEGIILDVRNNPGGLLNSAVDVAGLWLPSGTTVLEEKRGGVIIQTLDSNGPAMLEDISTVVLINEGSASASEILAGALKDNGAATLLGAQTFGKGSVQQLANLSDGGILKVTIARWFTPGGKNIDKEGIKPDKTVELTSEDITNNKDPQQAAAAEMLRQ